MPLLEKELESFELDVVRRYQDFMRRAGAQATRSMFLGDYLALQDARMPQQIQDSFVMAGHKLFLNLKLPVLDDPETRCTPARRHRIIASSKDAATLPPLPGPRQ
jgi:hypothetical protein